MLILSAFELELYPVGNSLQESTKTFSGILPVPLTGYPFQLAQTYPNSADTQIPGYPGDLDNTELFTDMRPGRSEAETW